MERRTGPDPGLDAEGTAAWDTLSTVAVSLVLLLFALLLSLQAVRPSGTVWTPVPEKPLRLRKSPDCAAPQEPWSCRRWPSFSGWRWRPGGALRILKAPPGSMPGPRSWSWRPRCCGTTT